MLSAATTTHLPNNGRTENPLAGENCRLLAAKSRLFGGIVVLPCCLAMSHCWSGCLALFARLGLLFDWAARCGFAV